jgi:hypothetical protein
MEEIYMIDEPDGRDEFYCPRCLAMFEEECCCDEFDNE